VVVLVGSLVSFGNMAAGFLIVTAATLVMVVIALRLCLYGVNAISERNLGLTASWAQTRGHATRFLGAFLLWGVVSAIISLVAGLIATTGGGAMGAQISGSTPETLALFLTPGWLFYSLVSGLASGFSALGFICIGAYAWHQMRGDLPAPVGSA
jgi:hypothetical protein